MACITKRRGAWVMDARIHGHRIVKVFRTKREAEEALAKHRIEQRQKNRPVVDPFITLGSYAERFVRNCEDQEVAESTLRRYKSVLNSHIRPSLDSRKIRDVSPADVRTFLSERARIPGSGEGQRRLVRNSVRQIRSVLSAVLSLAVSEEVISSNPVLGVSRERRTRARRQRERARVGEQVKAMTRAERNTFLAVAAQRRPEIGPAFVLMALAGLRLGEVLGIRWAAVDFEKKRLCIHEQLEIDATKSGAERMVDLAGPLEALLRGLKAQRLEASMAAKKGGEIAAQRIVFPDLPVKADRKVQQAAEKRVRRAMAYCLKTAGLSSHFTPHSLRHTFCSLLIADSISPVYVQQQAGHASVDLTVRVYGSWFAVDAPGAMDRLAAGSPGSQVVTNVAEMATSGDPSLPQALPPTGTSGHASISRRCSG